MNAQAAPIRWRPLWTLPQNGAALSALQTLEVELAQPLIFASLPQLAVANTIAAAFWAVTLALGHNPLALVWAALIHLALAHRWLASAAYRRTPPEWRQPLRALRRLLWSQGISGAIWGLAPWLLLPGSSAPLTVAPLIMLVLLGMSSVSMIALARFRDAMLAFNAPLFLGLSSALVWQGGGLNGLLAVAALLYFASTMTYGMQQNALLIDHLRARRQSDELATKLAQQVEAVQQASAEKTRFFASASHDLRQPLHSLGLFGSAIAARLKGTSDEAMARNLMHCVDALETSFSSMLDVSKLDAGVVEAQPQPVALADVFRRLESAYGRQAESQGLALRFCPAGRWVLADPALLERLLGNLIHNALKFTVQGGVSLVARNRHGATSVEVWDTGVGMAPPELARIFDEFYQVGNQERDRAKGLGMGLAIVKRLATLMAAPLSVQARQGRGSVFKLALPSAQPGMASEPQPALASSAFRSLQGLRVLVVDDEATVRDSTSAALRLYGLHVEVADSKEQALEAVRDLNGQIDAVITDYRLRGGADGIVVAQDIHRLMGRKVPTFLITGDTAPDRVRQARASGLHVLYKPVKATTLVEAIRAQAAGKFAA